MIQFIITAKTQVQKCELIFTHSTFVSKRFSFFSCLSTKYLLTRRRYCGNIFSSTLTHTMPKSFFSFRYFNIIICDHTKNAKNYYKNNQFLTNITLKEAALLLKGTAKTAKPIILSDC